MCSNKKHPTTAKYHNPITFFIFNSIPIFKSRCLYISVYLKHISQHCRQILSKFINDLNFLKVFPESSNLFLVYLPLKNPALTSTILENDLSYPTINELYCSSFFVWSSENRARLFIQMWGLTLPIRIIFLSVSLIIRLLKCSLFSSLTRIFQLLSSFCM